MYGLMVIGALVIYAVVSLAVVMYATVNGGKLGGPGWLWGLVAALVMYNLVFWDYLPTVIAHKYYCEKEAGFWVYKTLDQWKAENPGEMETLVSNKGVPETRQGDMQNFTDTNPLNQRFNYVLRKSGPHLFNLWRWDEEVVDGKNNEVLARYSNFSTGNGNIGGEIELRFWLHNDGCASGSAHPQHQFYEYVNQITGKDK